VLRGTALPGRRALDRCRRRRGGGGLALGALAALALPDGVPALVEAPVVAAAAAAAS
jgi:hypothetical protein